MPESPQVLPLCAPVRKSDVYTRYVQSLPERPYCTNKLGNHLLIRKAETAVQFMHVQPNRDLVMRWMIFDIDHPDAFFVPEDRDCPPPTYMALNRKNGHGHAGYLLETPVTAFTTSSASARGFFRDVERGLRNRLGADPSYSGFLTKSPLSPQWETAWLAQRPYHLETLNDCLSKHDKRKAKAVEPPSAFGRNCTLFDTLRKIAYGEVLKFKKAGNPFWEFESALLLVAKSVNGDFEYPLLPREVESVCRSVVGWTWDRFTVERMSAIKSALVRRRWKDHVPARETKPWEAEGVSRATYYRRKRIRAVIPDKYSLTERRRNEESPRFLRGSQAAREFSPSSYP